MLSFCLCGLNSSIIGTKSKSSMQGMTRSDTELPETTTRAELGSQENNYNMQKKRDGGAVPNLVA